MRVFAFLTVLLSQVLPGTQSGQGPKPAARPPYSIGQNGLVVPDADAKSKRNGTRVRSDFEEPSPAPGGASAFPARVPKQSAPRDEEPAVGKLKPPENLDLGSALLDVFHRVGHPSAFVGLGSVVAKWRLTVFDAYGAESAVRDLVQESDLGNPSRDRLSYPAAQKFYGRDGGATWVVFHGMDWPALEQEAREELELFGLLLRMPWCFADTQRFVVYPRESVVQDGRRYTKVRIEARSSGDEIIGPRDSGPAPDTYELTAPADSYEPTELRIQRANGTRRSVKLLEWRDVGGVRVPMRRIFVTPDGTQALEIVATQLEPRQSLPDSRFHPPGR